MVKKIEDEFTDIDRNGRSAQYLAELRYDLRRLKLGLCAYRGCKEKGIGHYCDKHRLYRNERQRLAWRKRQAEPKA